MLDQAAQENIYALQAINQGVNVTPRMNEETLPEKANTYEKKYYQTWYAAYQDEISWEEFKSNGYKISTTKKAKTNKPTVDNTLKLTRFSFLPKDIARTSPFFPMKKTEKTTRPIYKDVVVNNKWGSITISGPKLSVNDEGVLLAIILLAKRYKVERFKSNYGEMCEIMGNARGGNSYKLVSEGLERLTKSVVDAKVFSKTNLDEREVEFSITGAIISNVYQQPKSTEFEVILNPYFLALYGSNMTTGIDMEKRAELKGDISKALYRFLESHSGGGVPFGLLTLCNAINLNTDQSLSEIRKLIRKALDELQKTNVIKTWKIDKKDNVQICK